VVFWAEVMTMDMSNEAIQQLFFQQIREMTMRGE
jgi:hypothetical protein